MHVWGPGNDGVEVRLLELPNKGHWICKEKQVYTGKEIWNFCKRFSLNKTSPNVKITAPATGGKFISYGPKNEVTFPDITITATADDPNGTVEKVEFYDGTTLLATCTAKPYKTTLSGAKAGKHKLKAVATDNDGETSTASVEVTLQAPTTTLSLSGFSEANAIPAGWTTYDSSEKRTGYSGGYSSGCRVLEFTGTTKGFNYGLYIRNINGNAKQCYAKFGLSGAGTTLSLAPGHYTLKYKVCNWNMANFGEVEVCVETRAGKSIASQTYTPNINIGNKTSNDFSTPAQQTFEFDVTEQDDYVIAFYSAASEWSDCIIGPVVSLAGKNYVTTEIGAQIVDRKSSDCKWFDLQGRRVDSPQKPGIYISNGKKIWKR